MSVLVGKEAPDFTAAAIMPDGSINEEFHFKSYIKDKVGVLFFWPLDFTFICPSEIIAFNNRVARFEELGAKIVGCSVDSHFTHHAWRSTPIDQGGVGEIRFPMVADLTKSIARSYDVLLNDSVAYRGTFMIDKSGKVRHQIVNDLPLGRNVEEAIRMVDALNFTEEHGEVCPANWQKGKSGMRPDKEGVATYLKEHAESL